ncbi:Uncharacterised protein [Segatella copri]|nr:Uncharacterised protein [Segatella copri]
MESIDSCGFSTFICAASLAANPVAALVALKGSNGSSCSLLVVTRLRSLCEVSLSKS